MEPSTRRGAAAGVSARELVTGTARRCAAVVLATAVVLHVGAASATARSGLLPGGVRDAVAYAGADGLTVAPIDAGHPKPLGVTGRDHDWSPDGRRLAYVGQGGVFTVDVGTSQAQRIATAEAASRPDWSPDGRWVVYSDQDSGRLVVVAADGRSDPCPCPVTTPSAGERDSDAAWSPDGAAIAFTRFDGRTGYQDVGVVTLEAFPDAVGAAAIIVDQASVAAMSAPSWSPDSTQLTFAAVTRTTGEPIDGDVYVADRAGRFLRLLVRPEAAGEGWRAYSPAFSPTGEEIAYTRNFTAGTQEDLENRADAGLYVVDVDGPSQSRQLASTRGEEVDPAWTADGRLVFQSRSDDSGCHCYLSDFWVVDADGNGLRQIDAPSDVPQMAVSPGTTVRLPGASRVETAVSVSTATHDTAERVVIATAGDYPDALAGAPLAAALDAPLLLVPNTGSVHPAVLRELERLQAAHAVLLGSASAVADGIVEHLRSAGLTTERVAGATRFDTAGRIARRLQAGEAFVVEGANADPTRGWPDAVAASGLAGHLRQPILLVERDRLPAETRAALVDGDYDRVRIIGGEASVSREVAAQIAELGVRVVRTGGRTRYETSAQLAELSAAVGLAPAAPWLTTGRNWPDSLAAGPAAVAHGGVLLLVDGRGLAGSPSTAALLGGDDPLDVAWLVGGADVITPEVRLQIERLRR